MRGRGGRLLAGLAVAGALLGAVEGGLRVAGVNPPDRIDRLLAGPFAEGAYLRRRDRDAGPWLVADGEELRTNPRLQRRGLHDERFFRDNEGRIRIFALGGSTVRGEPYVHTTKGFPELVGRGLQEALPARRPQVINLGVSGMDSSGFWPIAREAFAAGATDLIVYAGDNETWGQLLDACTDKVRMGLEGGLRRSRIFKLLLRGVERLRPAPLPDRAALEGDQERCATAALDRALRAPSPPVRGLRGDALHARTVLAFADHLRRLADAAADAGVRVWMGIPAARLDWAPEAARPHPALPEADRAALEAALARGDRASLEAAVALDPTHAGALHALGSSLMGEDPVRAKALLQAALDWDYGARRSTGPLVDAVRALCAERPELRCVDVHSAFVDASPGGIPGGNLYVDACHPNRGPGTKRLAEAFLAEMLPAFGAEPPAERGARRIPGRSAGDGEKRASGAVLPRVP